MVREALVVGINRYDNYSKDQQLTAPAYDAELMAQRLEVDGFWRVRRLPEVTLTSGKRQIGRSQSVTIAELEAAIADLFYPKTTKNRPDAALLYFSGHGLRKEVGSKSKVFLGASNVDPDAGLWGYPLADLQELLIDSQIATQVVWLDCCYSGGLLNFSDGDPRRAGTARDRFLLAASQDHQVAYTDTTTPYSEFTKKLWFSLQPSYQKDITSVDVMHKLGQEIPERQRSLFACSGNPIPLIPIVSPSSETLEADLQQIIRNLDQVLTEPEWREVYDLVQPENQFPTAQEQAVPTNLSEAITILKQQAKPGEDFPHYYFFVNILRRFENENREQVLRNDIENWFRYSNINLADLKKRVINIQDSATQPSTPQNLTINAGSFQCHDPHLLFQIKQSDNSGEYLLLSFYIPNPAEYDYDAETDIGCSQVQDPVSVDPHHLEEKLQETIQDCLKSKQKTEQVSIFMPGDKLSLAIDQFFSTPRRSKLVPPPKLGEKCRVVLGLSLRFEEGYQKEWEQRSTKLNPEVPPSLNPKPSEAELIAVLSQEEDNIIDLHSQLRNNSEKLGFYLRSPLLEENSEIPDLLLILVYTGAPIAFWPRDPSAETEWTEHLPQLLDTPVHKLPHKIQDWRKQYSESWGKHIALIWDDPRLRPPDAGKLGVETD